MNAKKLMAGGLAAAMLAVGGTTALAAGQNPAGQGEDPNYKGSIAAPQEQGEQNESAESSQLQKLAKINSSEAEKAATQAVSGKVQSTELGNENGYVVYEVQVKDANGKLHEVKVDAGDGKVLAQEADDEGSENGETGERNDGNEQNEANEGSEATNR